MDLQHYFKRGVAVPLGYSPNSASVKPVHIANGLCRAALGEYYDPRVLNQALIRWAKHGSEERHPTPELVEAAREQLGELAEPRHLARLNDLRELLRGVLGADGAVFDKNDNCSYTLTHKAHVTRDHNDRGTGDFLYGVLSADLGSGPSPSIQLVRDLLEDASDEISVLSLPLTTGEEPHSYDPERDETPAALEVKRNGSAQVFRSQILRELRAGFDALASFERANGSKLHSLRRLMLFATLALYLHLTHRGLEYEDGRSYGAQRPLLLADFLQSGWSAIANASHATYNMGSKKIEAMITHGVRSVLVEEHGERWTTKQIEDFIDEIEFKGGEKKKERSRKHFHEVYRSYSQAMRTNLDAFVHAMVDVMLEDLSGTPFDFARALGVRGGLLAPRGQRAVKKRYAPSPELLEVLLAASMTTAEELELSELALRWRERFGIITGALPTDPRDLAGASIFDATKEDLVRNANALRDILIEIGYGQRYADGVTIIRLRGSVRT